MNNAECPNCKSDDVEWVGNDNGIDEYICTECGFHFIIDWIKEDVKQFNEDFGLTHNFYEAEGIDMEDSDE